MKTTFISKTLIIIAIYACSNKNIEPINLEHDVISNVTDIQITKNNKWIFLGLDSLSKKTDTLSIEIKTSANSLTDKNLWILKEKNIADTTFYIYKSDSILFFAKQSDNISISKIIFPLKVGSKWRNTLNASDSTYVLKYENVKNNSRAFDDCTILLRKINSFNYYSSEYIWIKKGIGIVKIKKTGFDSFIVTNITYNLLESK